MAKIEKANEDVLNLFYDVRDNTSIPSWVEFEVLSNSKQKELYKITKCNDIVEVISKGINFVVVFNEEILEELPEDMQRLAIDECLAGVSVSESDVLSLEKPNVSTHRGVLQKYGNEPVITLHESIKSLFDAKKEREDQERAITKGGKGKTA